MKKGILLSYKNINIFQICYLLKKNQADIEYYFY